MSQLFKDYLRYLIYKTLGTAAFARRIEWRRMMRWLDAQKGEKILDIACGAGELSLKIAERGCEVYGIDLSEEGIKSARRLSKRVKARCEFMVGDAERLPFADGCFDKIICSSSLEHFNNDARALGEMRRVLKADGRVILTVDSLTYPISPELKERHRKMCAVNHYYTREELAKALNAAGFQARRSEYLLTSFLTSYFFKRWIKNNRTGVEDLLVAALAHPLLLISDRLFGAKDRGYTLIAEAVKID
jgi:ubiquinone/menaquinone biosynthesis C-methylase UbiE